MRVMNLWTKITLILRGYAGGKTIIKLFHPPGDDVHGASRPEGASGFGDDDGGTGHAPWQPPRH